MTVEEYLATSFEDGDREYVDGVVEEKNLGEFDHGDVQGLIYNWFFVRRRKLGICPVVEVRTRVSPTRYRVPDVTVVRGDRPAVRIITDPPLLAIEVLSPDDRASRADAKIDEYLRFGISYVWVINPKTGCGHIYTSEKRIAVEDGKFRTTDPPIEMDFAELFADAD